MEEFLTVSEAAEQLQMKVGTVRRWIHNGLIEALTLPSSGKLHHYRVKKSVVEEIKQQKKQTRWYLE